MWVGGGGGRGSELPSEGVLAGFGEEAALRDYLSRAMLTESTQFDSDEEPLVRSPPRLHNMATQAQTAGAPVPDAIRLCCALTC